MKTLAVVIEHGNVNVFANRHTAVSMEDKLLHE